MFQTPDVAPLRGMDTPDKNFGFYDATIDGGWQVPGEPYSVGTDAGETPFRWWRSRMLGGRTNHWGRISLRNGPYDFKPQSRDGLGINWPIAYEDLAPYYDKVEMLVGVYGANDGLENTPNSSPGCLLPPPKPIVSDLLVQKHSAKLGFPTIAGHRAVLTQALDWREFAGEVASGESDGPENHCAGHAKARALLLGHTVWQRVLDPRQLSIDYRTFTARPCERKARHSHRRNGRRSHPAQKRPSLGSALR